MRRNASSEILASPRQRLSLDRKLYLIWRWMKYTGLTPDLLLISVEQRHLIGSVRYLFTVFILLLSLAYGIFELIQLAIEIWSVKKMVETVPNFLHSTYIIVSLVCQCLIWFRRHHIVQLFNDWKQVEMESKFTSLAIIKRAVFGQNIFCLVFSVIAPLVVFIRNFLEPHSSLFLSHYSIVRETFNLLLVCAVHSIVAGYVTFMLSINILFPMMFFYHMAAIVGNLAEEWDARLRNEEYLRVVWQKYERILHLTERANKSFGPVLVVLHIYFVFEICLMVFFTIEEFQALKSTRFNSLATAIALKLCLAFLNWTFSQLYLSTNTLQKTVADELSQKWHQLDQSNRHLYVSFLMRLGKGDMSVRPLNLFTVSPSNLLSVSAIIMNYTVVLAQSA